MPHEQFMEMAAAGIWALLLVNTCLVALPRRR